MMTSRTLANIAGKLNAFKTAIKTAHWNETECMNKHEQLDNIYSILHYFQDNLVDDIQEYVYKIKAELSKYTEPEMSGINGLCDSLIHDINIAVYRIRMQ